MASFCTWWVYVYDDCSTDNTYDICNKHHIVKGIIAWNTHEEDREKAEYQNRQVVLEMAKKNALPEDRFIYMDADERI